MSSVSDSHRFLNPLKEVQAEDHGQIHSNNPEFKLRRQKAETKRERGSSSQHDQIRLEEISDRIQSNENRSRNRPASSRTPSLDGEVEDEEVQEGGLEGWLVVFACSLSFFITLGLVYSFGVLQAELISRGVATASTLGWVSSTTVISLPVFAVPCNAFCIRYGNRITGLLGAFLTGTGYLWTSFVMKKDDIVWLFLAQAVFGLGYAFTFWATNSLAASYFRKKRGLAVGIVYSGSGLGGAIFSICLSHLIQKIGLEWSVRIWSLIAFGVLLPTSLLLKQKKKAQPGRFTLAYFKDLKFNLLMLGTALTTFSIFVPPFFLPTYTVSAGYSATTGAWLVAGNNLSSALGRVLFGLLADSRVGPVTSLLLAIFLMGTSILAIWQASSNLIALIFFILVNGSASGALLSLQPPVNASLFGMEDFANTMSLLFMSRAFGSALGGPIAGYLLDAFGGPDAGTKAYRPALLLFGLLSLASGGFILGVRWIVGGCDLKKRV